MIELNEVCLFLFLSKINTDPDPIAIPQLARFSAGASFTPSPVTATVPPRFWHS